MNKKRCHICGAEMSHANPEICKNFHVQQAHSSEQPKELRKVIIREPHKATALTNGWLCFKYLDNGEESLSTFADISKGDVITYDRPHPAPATKQAYRNGYDDGYALAMNEAGEKFLEKIDKEIAARYPRYKEEIEHRATRKAREDFAKKIIPTLGKAIQTDVSENDYVMIEDLKSTIDWLVQQAGEPK